MMISLLFGYLHLASSAALKEESKRLGAQVSGSSLIW